MDTWDGVGWTKEARAREDGNRDTHVANPGAIASIACISLSHLKRKMNPYVQYIESGGNLVALKELSSVFGVFSKPSASTDPDVPESLIPDTYRIASWTFDGSTSVLEVSIAPRDGWPHGPLPMSVVLKVDTLKVYSKKSGGRYGVRPSREGGWWVLTCDVDAAQPRRDLAQANHRADVSNGWKELFKGPEMKA